MKNVAIKAVFITLISFTIVGCIHAFPCLSHGTTGGRRCEHTLISAPVFEATKFYEVGEVWDDGICVECRCHPVTYRTLNCSLMTRHGIPGPDKVRSFYEDIDILPSSCPTGFIEMKESSKHLPSLMFLVFRTIETVETRCCSRYQLASFPDECEAIPHDSDPCKDKYVLKSNNTVECPGVKIFI
ncbi:uncharacterized protein LOC120339535 [Styela clava]